MSLSSSAQANALAIINDQSRRNRRWNGLMAVACILPAILIDSSTHDSFRPDIAAVLLACGLLAKETSDFWHNRTLRTAARAVTGRGTALTAAQKQNLIVELGESNAHRVFGAIPSPQQ